MGANSGSSRDDYYANQQAGKDYAESQKPAPKSDYGMEGIASQSLRQRGEAGQKRVGVDTRVREDASSGTTGAGGVESGMGQAMGMPSQAAQPPASEQAAIPQNTSWQSTRQSVDLASVRQRVLQSLLGQNTGGSQ